MTCCCDNVKAPVELYALTAMKGVELCGEIVIAVAPLTDADKLLDRMMYSHEPVIVAGKKVYVMRRSKSFHPTAICHYTLEFAP